MSARSRRGLFAILAGAALALLAGRWAAGWYAERAFVHALGFHAIWHAKALTLGVIGSSTFAAVAAFTFLNLFAVRQSIVSLVLPRQVGNLELAEAIPTGRLTVAAAAVAVAIGLLFALLPHDWTAAALAWEGVAFRELDPYLERDLGFYVAWLPFERSLQERSIAVTITVGLLVCVFYALTPSIRWSAGGLYVSAWVRRHLSVLAGLVVLMVGWDWRLDRYERLADGSGVTALADAAGLFTAYDHRVALPYLAIASFAAVPIGAVLVWAGWRGYLRLALAMLSALILGGPVAGALLPLVARGPLERAEAQRRERSYLNTSALFTRRAFGVDEIAGGDTIGLSALALREVATSVTAWDPAALGALVASGDRDARPTSVAWRASGRGLEAVFLRALPAAAEPFDWAAEPWRAAMADAAGRPYLARGVGSERIPGVLVYPGATGALLLGDSLNAIAAPAFRQTLDRLALAWDLQDPRLLFRELPAAPPRLVTSRDVRQRVRRVLPFLAAGPTITPVLRGDSLYWFVELFVTARRYPLSQPVTADGREVHYARHAGSAIVQAQTGVITVVPTERPDPVMARWIRRFPDTFTPLAGAPEWVRSARPPAVDQMLVQGSALSRVGFQGDTLGRRRLARPDDADADLARGEPSLFQFDSLGALGWALPVDVPSAGRTLGILVARGGADRRTEFVSDPGPRWTSILESMQRAADSAGFGRTLPGLRRGRVQAIPTVNGAVWVQSYYEWPADQAPRLAGVVVRSGDALRTGRTLAEALGVQVVGVPVAPDAFRERVAVLYDAMLAAQRAGDWRAYGDAVAALGRLLGRP